MPFELVDCTQELQSELHLVESMGESRSHEWIGKQVIVDRVNRLAILPHDYCHGDYPDRVFTFFFDGELAGAVQWIGEAGEESRITITFEAHTPDERCRALAALFESGLLLLRDRYLPLPITWEKRRAKNEVRQPRTTKRVIEKLNQLCSDLSVIDASVLASLEEVTIQSVISDTLMPEELEALRRHLTDNGWADLSRSAQDLMRKVLSRVDQS